MGTTNDSKILSAKKKQFIHLMIMILKQNYQISILSKSKVKIELQKIGRTCPTRASKIV